MDSADATSYSSDEVLQTDPFRENGVVEWIGHASERVKDCVDKEEPG